ncbi:MAG TPA: branched-chain amino acid ABC transporter permease, partial [Verrucomicrobiae bacterium]|nr:branched-chain amino acid ABC transporter permease [Verrucomicrobiae bacterium]
DSDPEFYYLAWAFCLGILLVSRNVVSSRVGRALRAIHGSESAARSLGIEVSRFEMKVFVLSAVYASIAGSLYAHTMTFISPASFGFHFSVELVTMVIVGGLGSIYGSFLGAALLTMLPELLRTFQDYDIIVYGLILILATMFMPGGLVREVPAALRGMMKRPGRGADA